MTLTQISTAGVKDDAVTSGKIPANAVGSSELADNAVDTAAIADDAVTTAKIAAGNVTATELATNSVEGGKITDSAITNAKIHPSAAIAGSKIDPSFTSNITVSGTDPRIIFTDTNNNPDFTLHANGGEMQVENSGSGTQVKLESSGSTRVFGNLTVDTNTLHVDSSNNLVSIGTTSGNSNFKLDVNGAARIGNTTDGIIIENSTSNPSVSNACRIHRNGATGELNITSGTTTARNMIFNTKTSGAESMRLTSTGDFCVGTTTATGKAEIATSASEVGLTVTNDTHDSYLQILATAANKNSAIFFGDNGDGNIGAIDYDHNDNSLSFSVNGGEKARLESAGSLLIGTTTTTGTSSSGNDIVIGSIGDSTDRGITLATSGTGTIRWADAGDNAQGRIQYSNSSDVMTLHTNNVERFRIDSTGRTGINVLDDNGGFVQMKPNHNFDDGASGIQSSGTRATLRVRTSSNSSMSLQIGGLDDSIDSARPYLQVGNRSAGGPTAFYDLYLCPFGGTVRTLQIIPKDDNSHDLGAGDKRWDDVFATNGTINTSDRNEKNTIVDSDLGLSFINKLKPVSYKFNGKTRTHYGLIAQDIETVLSDISKSTTDFAGFIKAEVSDVLYTEDEPLPTGKNVGDVKTPGTTNYGLRYAEFIAPLVKAVQELSDKVAALEAAQ